MALTRQAMQTYDIFLAPSKIFKPIQMVDQITHFYQVYNNTFLENCFFKSERRQKTQNQTSHSTTINNSGTSKRQNSLEKKSNNNKKRKIIRKRRQRKNIRKIPYDFEQDSNYRKKTRGNKSKYNNMGGFLIGSVSQILNQRGKHYFTRGVYGIQIQGVSIPIGNYDKKYEKNLIEVMKKLKSQILKLPRKQGVKKDLFKLINPNSRDDSYQKKVCKKFLRLELIYSLKQQVWLREHVLSREFKPTNDETGAKKKERHIAYFAYLTAIKTALIDKDELPKRLNL